MEFRLPRLELLRGLRLAAGVADRKSTMPMLGNVLLRVAKRKLLIVATDLNVSLSCEMPTTKTDRDGALTLSAKMLHDIVAGAPGDEIRLKSTDANWLEVKCGKASYRVVGMADRDFPKVPDHREIDMSIIDAATLRQLIDRTLISVCNDETRHHLSGVYLLTDGKQLTGVSTDGHRLSLATMPLTAKLSSAGVIVPRKGLVEIKRLIADVETCSVGVKLPYLFVRCDETSLAVKLVDATFPPYEQVIPTSNDVSVTVDRSRLIESLRRMQAMTTDMRGVKLSPADGGVQLTAADPDRGDVTEDLDCEVNGKMPTVGCNPKYVLELLSQMSTDMVVLLLDANSELAPMLVQQLADDSYSGVVMPMRV